MAGGLITLEDAWARLLDGAAPAGSERVPLAERVLLAEAHGRVLAEDVAHRLTHPPADQSAMDGWAIRFGDMPGPWVRLPGESAAGRPFAGLVGPRQAVRVFTGGAMPAGADAVVVQEDARVADGLVALAGGGPPGPGAHVRRAGQDFRAGGVAVRRGDVLTAARLGLLAAGGHGAVQVWPRPRVALLATGDELVPPGETPGPGRIAASHGAMLSALVAAAGGQAHDLGLVRDEPAALADALARAAAFDVLVTVGGASVGDHDLVRPALLAAGARIDAWRVAIRPGKPVLFGRLRGARVVGLPGNPVSAFVCAILFLQPLVRALAGRRTVMPPTERRPLGAPMAANGARRDFVRAVLRDGAAVPLAVQDSAGLSVLASADRLVIRMENAPPAGIGAEMDCIVLESREA